MGDISEVRILLVVGCFIGCFTTVTAAGYLAFSSVNPNASGRTLTVPTGAFDAKTIQNLNYSYGVSFKLNYTAGIATFKIDGVDYEVECFPDNTIVFRHVIWWGGPLHTNYDMTWYDLNGTQVSHETTDIGGYVYRWMEVSEFTPIEYGDDIIYRLVSPQENVLNIAFTYQGSINWQDAYTERWIDAYTGGSSDTAGTVANAWDLMAEIIWFQSPEVHPLINILLHTPIWLAVGYLIFIIVLRISGAVFGGGGA